MVLQGVRGIGIVIATSLRSSRVMDPFPPMSSFLPFFFSFFFLSTYMLLLLFYASRDIPDPYPMLFFFSSTVLVTRLCRLSLLDL